MIALPARARPAGRTLRPVAMVIGLAIVVGIRWAVVVGDAMPALAVGTGFGVGLMALAVLGGGRMPRPNAVSAGVGFAGGLVLVGLAAGSRIVGVPGSSFAPAAALLPWAGVTILVAIAEELVLRAALFDALADVHGDGAAVVVTSLVFALMHVPLYGWHVVPLDLGVGLWLGGLRLVSGSVVAPAIAHAVADLATWWL